MCILSVCVYLSLRVCVYECAVLALACLMRESSLEPTLRMLLDWLFRGDSASQRLSRFDLPESVTPKISPRLADERWVSAGFGKELAKLLAFPDEV